MNNNKLLYNAAGALLECAKYVRPIDRDYAQELLDKSEELLHRIVIDQAVEQEVNELEQIIKERRT